jgi:hypothetical protein
MTDLPEHRVAVTVFATVRAVDERDGGSIVEHALRDLIKRCADGDGHLVVYLHGEPRPVSVVDVMETGMAAGNGYLWLRPTPKSYRERGGS